MLWRKSEQIVEGIWEGGGKFGNQKEEKGDTTNITSQSRGSARKGRCAARNSSRRTRRRWPPFAPHPLHVKMRNRLGQQPAKTSASPS
jgi:hypothetical protein